MLRKESLNIGGMSRHAWDTHRTDCSCLCVLWCVGVCRSETSTELSSIASCPSSPSITHKQIKSAVSETNVWARLAHTTVHDTSDSKLAQTLFISWNSCMVKFNYSLVFSGAPSSQRNKTYGEIRQSFWPSPTLLAAILLLFSLSLQHKAIFFLHHKVRYLFFPITLPSHMLSFDPYTITHTHTNSLIPPYPSFILYTHEY